jgi:hypothetical protein
MTSETDTWSEIFHGEITCSGSNEAQMVVVRTTPRLGLCSSNDVSISNPTVGVGGTSYLGIAIVKESCIMLVCPGCSLC